MKMKLAVLLILLSGPVMAKDPVQVLHTGNDIVGERLVYAIKEGVQRSASMRISESERGRVGVIISSVDMKDGGLDGVSAYSIVWVLAQEGNGVSIYIDSTVGFCGGLRVAECADAIVARTSSRIESIRPVLDGVGVRGK
ncbi:MAG: hypothetical protein HYV16_05550 [Gammaproteobacteria bacterium]|nr:hypothetical protein [Gammaproteobacteria bacterium]